MGKYLRYEDSNWRTYKIDTTSSTIKRPKKNITKEDLFCSIFEVNDELCFVVGVSETETVITAYVVAGGTISPITYTKATNVFAFNSTNLTSSFIDEYGREEQFV